MIVRSAVGLAMALALAAAARRAGSLSTSGAIAATFAGAICVAAGWSWGVLLVAFFVASSALSRVGEVVKEERVEGVVAKGGRRDGMQVLANGGVFALTAALSLLVPWHGWLAAGAGALAASTADTWGTEIGLLRGGVPRLVTSWRRVAPGMSGGVTPAGLFGSLAGAAFIALGAMLVGWGPGAALAALAGGTAGAMADSVAGALIQARRRCPECSVPTEREFHTCGATTVHSGGLAWIGNDLVNLLASSTGALVGLLFA